MSKDQAPLIFKGHDIDTLDAAALREAVRWLAEELRKGDNRVVESKKYVVRG